MKFQKDNPNTIVALHNGSPIEMPWANKANAIANIMYGIANRPGTSC